MSQESQNAFLQDLQKQCLEDSREYLDGFLEALRHFQADPLRSFSMIASHVHSLKGNLQAAGFLNFADCVHQFESVISNFESKIKSKEWSLNSDDLSLIEFLLSDIQFNFTEYLSELQGTFIDSEELANKRKVMIQSLGSWGPQTAQSAISPQVVQTQDEPQVSESKVTEPKTTEPVAQSLPKKNGTSEKTKPMNQTYFLCGNDGQKFAVPVQYVNEIIRPLQITRLPAVRNGIFGLLNLRGSTVPVLNLDWALGDQKKVRYMVICQVREYQFAFQVEEAVQVIDIPESTFQYIETNFEQSKLNSQLFTHLSIIEEKTIFIMNLDHLIADTVAA